MIGLEDGQSVGEPVSFSVAVTRRKPSPPSARSRAAILPPKARQLHHRPLAFEPGGQTLTVTATSGGRSGTAQVNFVVAASAADSVDGSVLGWRQHDRDVIFDFVSQSRSFTSPSSSKRRLCDLVQAPFGVTLNVLDYPRRTRHARDCRHAAAAAAPRHSVHIALERQRPPPRRPFSPRRLRCHRDRQAVETASSVQATQAAQVPNQVPVARQARRSGDAGRPASATAVHAPKTRSTQRRATSVQATQARRLADSTNRSGDAGRQATRPRSWRPKTAQHGGDCYVRSGDAVARRPRPRRQLRPVRRLPR